MCGIESQSLPQYLAAEIQQANSAKFAAQLRTDKRNKQHTFSVNSAQIQRSTAYIDTVPIEMH
ncbi:hypothetical protein NL453_27995, partial [Klebsiella pneumoniae]|nr:hypothetical protein [Klebsiella pneumoniae]